MQNPVSGSDHPSQVFKESRIGFIYTLGVTNRDMLDPGAGQGKAHGHAMVVVRVDVCMPHMFGGGNDQRIILDLDTCVKFLQFSGHGGGAVRFLFSQRVQAAEVESPSAKRATTASVW